MKKAFSIAVILLGFISCFSQEERNERHRTTVGAQLNQEFVLDGYVHVREWELVGDKMKLKELGMTSYPAVQLYLERHLKKSRILAFAYDHYFMHGRSTFDRDIIYNGTIINGRKGIDVSPTVYFRASAIYTGPLVNHAYFALRYKVALVLDYIKFYLEGEVTPSSPSQEVYEGFGRQAFPYPLIGLIGKIYVSEKSNINFEVSGTYIPRFTSFYKEGGYVDLQYSNFLTATNYSCLFGDFEVALGLNLRHMHLFQESKEDTNIITTLTAGPYIETRYQF